MQQDSNRITEHLANEQTFLAWLRTGVEVMAFGFVAIKFSLFTSQIMGISLVGTGALMILLSYFRYRKTLKQLRSESYTYSGSLLTFTASVILLISAVLMYCLIDAYFNPESYRPRQEAEKLNQ